MSGGVWLVFANCCAIYLSCAAVLTLVARINSKGGRR